MNTSRSKKEVANMHNLMVNTISKTKYIRKAKADIGLIYKLYEKY